MLYDPKWQKQTETKVDPLTIPALIAWLETQDPEQTYNFHDCDGRCLIGFYYLSVFGKGVFRRHGRPALADVFGSYGSEERCRGYTAVAATEPWTFGAALERARAFIA